MQPPVLSLGGSWQKLLCLKSTVLEGARSVGHNHGQTPFMSQPQMQIAICGSAFSAPCSPWSVSVYWSGLASAAGSPPLTLLPAAENSLPAGGHLHGSSHLGASGGRRSCFCNSLLQVAGCLCGGWHSPRPGRYMVRPSIHRILAGRVPFKVCDKRAVVDQRRCKEARASCEPLCALTVLVVGVREADRVRYPALLGVTPLVLAVPGRLHHHKHGRQPLAEWQRKRKERQCLSTPHPADCTMAKHTCTLFCGPAGQRGDRDGIQQADRCSIRLAPLILTLILSTCAWIAPLLTAFHCPSNTFR